MAIDVAVQSRRKFLVGGACVALAVRINDFINLNEPASAQVIGSFFGAAAGGAILGWIAWWAWAKTKK
ncbi:MAG: hypothetical protein V4724_16310 [Pseudomonadota bacterium]